MELHLYVTHSLITLKTVTFRETKLCLKKVNSSNFIIKGCNVKNILGFIQLISLLFIIADNRFVLQVHHQKVNCTDDILVERNSCGQY